MQTSQKYSHFLSDAGIWYTSTVINREIPPLVFPYTHSFSIRIKIRANFMRTVFHHDFHLMWLLLLLLLLFDLLLSFSQPLSTLQHKWVIQRVSWREYVTSWILVLNSCPFLSFIISLCKSSRIFPMIFNSRTHNFRMTHIHIRETSTWLLWMRIFRLVGIYSQPVFFFFAPSISF